MPGAQWLELLCRHIPDRFEHLVRYVGWYSNRVRARRAAAGAAAPVAQEPEPAQEIATRAKSSWARLIKSSNTWVFGPRGRTNARRLRVSKRRFPPIMC